jgi:IclR helix-turn-helix domain
MKQRSEVSIVLTSAQLAHVMRDTSGWQNGMPSLLGTFGDPNLAARVIDAQPSAAHFSRSVLRALLVLAAFPPDGTYRPLIDVAKELGYTASTTHRYAITWLAIGLLEQDPKSRRYRRPVASPTATRSPSAGKKRSVATKAA